MRLAALYHFQAIRIERVVDDPLRGIVFMVVLEAEMPKAFGDSFEARPLGLMVQRLVGGGAVDDPPQQHQSGVAGEFVLLQDCFERAFLAVMTKLDVLDVVGNGVKTAGLRHHLLPGHEHELGVLVDELPEEPRACDAVGFDLFAGDPFHAEFPAVFVSYCIRCPKAREFRHARVKSLRAGPAPPATSYERRRRSWSACRGRCEDRRSRPAPARRWRHEPDRLPG